MYLYFKIILFYFTWVYLKAGMDYVLKFLLLSPLRFYNVMTIL